MCCERCGDFAARERARVSVHGAVRHAAKLRWLAGLVSSVMELDALAGHLFVFSNRQRDRVKILYWDRDGFAVWAKRLEEGTYAMPFGKSEERRCELSAQELSALLSGIDLSQAKRRKRYERNRTNTA